MGRAPCCDKNGLKKGPWTPEEDQKLIDYIKKHGHGSWRTLPKSAGLSRCGKSCRLRWTNYLRPDIKRGRFSFEEEETIIQLHSILGNKWSAIAARLPGRTDNEIKNYWNTHIRKRLLRMGIDPVTHSPRLDLLDLSSMASLLNSSLYNLSQYDLSKFLGLDQTLVNTDVLRLASGLLNSQTENTDLLLHSLLQNNHLTTTQMQNPYQNFQNPTQNVIPNPQIQAQIPEIPSCTTSNTQFFSETQYPSNFSAQTLPPCPMFPETPNVIDSNLGDNIEPLLNLCYPCGGEQSVLDPLSETSTYQSTNTSNQSFGFASVLSTPTSSPTPLNSSSNYVNSYTEDERDSYCSNLIQQFSIPDLLDML
ncbi:hypothetical protein AMTRI_Chr02g218170 [Amborella trichopoda]|uniref:Uncharacterized protein n=1 Tax=Amborella trichopoda TaxID=13333 RepID=W1P7G7_AMBTC|nr:transcription factor MYB39 [Amborella trichopoda]ERN03536.1 hypothetical protein AMTR_s00003p00271440 [Amborella trichopoda]|eukprot:XP_006841861.1 transcription factor MYB39 [Amborella trichopoda]